MLNRRDSSVPPTVRPPSARARYTTTVDRGGYLQPPRMGLPPTESPRRRRFIQSIALAALLVTLTYLTWRLLATMPSGAALLVGIPFFLLEFHGAVTLALFVFSAWDVDAPPVPVQTNPPPTVTVLIATYNEPLEVLLPTVAACLALDGEHETWVLDDGNRLEVEEVVTALGARYVTRPVHDHAKAGNLNHALSHCRSELIAVFDADHVPEPSFLARTVPYFADPRLALVQTPQDFYNSDSFEHYKRGPDVHEESLFYRVVQAGKNRYGAAFWCGTNAVLRVEALRQIGGVATETITEDMHTTVRLHSAGWRSLYHNEVLARGLAAATPAQFYTQRYRWGRGAMQQLKVDNPVLAPGLTIGQRIAYAYSVSSWFESWRVLGLSLVLVVTVLTGLCPVVAPAAQFLLMTGAMLILHHVAALVLGRGFTTIRHSLLFDIIRMPSNLTATLSLLQRRPSQFAVTVKGRTGEKHRRAPIPLVIAGLGLLNGCTLVYAVLTFAGCTPTDYTSIARVAVPLVWLVVSTGFLVAAVRRIRSLDHADEQRDAYRLTVTSAVSVDGVRGSLVDISMGGARIRLPGRQLGVGSKVEFAIRVPTGEGEIRLGSSVLSCADGTVRVQFLGRQWAEMAALALTVFRTGGCDPSAPAAHQLPSHPGESIGLEFRRADRARCVA